ncbi:DUF397 domain-containing protein [Streptomyces sp. JJ66]|uniref:DUF397 domain-containing protein n=1 Tax=Streptomyces sp. JJ66 TaxID=2803843 RepID=UPI001C570D1D|nr:DUF397 domain-containing protein [Streptomyces sp. JJ66]MBW1603836.1 DUF397 domain-containing protein [Streptomyces sp. JJ66]
MSHRTPDLSAAVWCKSSYSNNTGGDCVEVARDFPGAAQWRKSSYSDNTGGDCVEVATGVTGVVPVRDSKRPGGSVLVFTASAWDAFVAGVK